VLTFHVSLPESRYAQPQALDRFVTDLLVRLRVLPGVASAGVIDRLPVADDETTEALRAKLAEFYAQRTITRRPISPEDCARAICWLAGDASAKTTGHVIPVDGGLAEAFLR